MMPIMSEKKLKFLNEVKDYGCAVLVGPLLGRKEWEQIPKDAPLLLVDGGADIAVKLGLKASRSILTVGDGDSSIEDIDHRFNPEKDFSDLTGALNLVPNDVVELRLFGFLGGRKDHEFINFGELNQYLKNKKVKSKAYLSQNILALGAGSWKINTEKGVFSLLSLEKGLVSLDGQVRYKVDPPREIDVLSSQYLSNYTEGEFTLTTKYPLYLFVEGTSLRAE